ncbi:conserved hypothetical protein [Beggiatoa sp. PS]|nr:conserved hypothetical protein [Beggiatoa sp. PS]
MNWTIESAKQQFTELINQAAQEPQPIFNDKKFVVAVIDAQTFKAFEQWQQTQSKTSSPANAFEELRQLCLEENYTLEIPNRYDRENAFINNTEKQ